MRKIQFFAFSAAAALALSMTTSCQKELEQAPASSSETSTVCFTLSEPDTKTAMGEIGDKVTNIWSSDDNDRMTFYQNGKASTAVRISLTDSYKHASFEADFNAATSESYKYKALLAANKVGDLPVVPAVQHPTASSFDPDANVLVGLETEAFDKVQTSVNLVYKHAAAISRISFSSIPDGLKIYGVQINASSAIAGAAKAVEYTTGAVDYSTASEKTISLIYDIAPSYSDGKFDAYFVTIPGSSVKITDIKLVTDKGTFVKTNSGSSTTTFDVSKFKTVKVTVPTTRTFYKATGLEDGTNFMIVSGTTAMKVNGTSNVSSQTNVGSVANNSLSVTGDVINSISSLLWTAEVSSTSFKLKSGSNYLYRNSSSLKGGNSTSSNNTFTYSNNYLMQGSRYAYYYNDGWTCNSTKTSVDIYTSKLPASSMLSFSAEAVECSLADKDSFVAPILSGAGNASVTYSSSNTAVATVDKTGAVTINGKGAAIITATATFASNGIYQGGTATAEYIVSVYKGNKLTLLRATEVTDGHKYVMVNSGYALQNVSAEMKALLVNETADHTSVTIDSDDFDSIVWTWSNSDINTEYGKYTVSNGTEYLIMTKVSSGWNSSTYTLNINAIPAGDAAKYAVWFYNNSQYVINSNDRYLRYDDGWSVKSGSTDADETCYTYLYEYEDPRTPQALSFTDESPEVDINDKKTYTQTVTGAQTDVTYSITSASPSDAATINATTGELTLKKRGTIVVTATAAGTDQYRPAEASYTLTVIDPNAKKTYSKVTAKPNPLDWSGTYLIVDESSKNIFAYDQTGYKKGVTIENNKIVSSELEKYEVTISATANDNTHYYVKTSNGQYLYNRGSDISSVFLNDSETYDSYNYYAKIGENGMISLGTRGQNSKNSKTTEVFFVYTSSAFKFSKTTNTIQLYKLDSSE